MAINPLLVTSGAGLLTDLIGFNNQQDIQQAQLNLARQSARDQKKLATATREDPFGNKLVYVPGQGFVYENTAMTDSILGAQQNEELLSLTQDASRNRQAAERQDDRSIEADDFFGELFNQERYRRRPSEREEEAEALLDNLAIRKENEGGAELQPFINNAIRTGDGSDLRRAIDVNDRAQPSFAEIVKQSRQEGRNNVVTNDQITAGNLNELGAIRSIADGAPQTPILQSNIAGSLEANSDQAMQNLMQVLSASGRDESSALSRMSSTSRSIPDFSKFIGQLVAAGGNEDEIDFWNTDRQQLMNMAIRG